MFDTSFEAILEKIEKIKPIEYGMTRNFIDGEVTRLSPYISRGVISTKFIFNRLLERGFEVTEMEKLVQELAWRDYWQQVWIARGDEINADLRHPQPDVCNYEMPQAILAGNTGIQAIDLAIEEFYETGYLHNHVRMYIASIACNVGKSHWKVPAQWMYYHLLDGDWASNALSWQWVAGSNSNKKYYANQENINKYCHSNQQNSFLTIEYSEFESLPIPAQLANLEKPKLKNPLPENQSIVIDPEKPICLYNSYNLDPRWKAEIEVNRILLLEPSHFESYPISKKSLNFILALGNNIPGLQVFVGEFDELANQHPSATFYYKEHPLNNHYRGIEESRDWMFPVTGYYRSFFAFWKKCKKTLKRQGF